MIYGFILLALIVITVLWFRQRTAQVAINTVSQSGFKVPDRKYHSVEIRFDENACSLVKALQGKRLLSSKVVGLPIQGCTAKVCNCRYVHYDDRRDRERRDNDYVGQAIRTDETWLNPRSRKDRRRSGNR